MGRPKGQGRKTVHLQLSAETISMLRLVSSANDGLGPSAALERIVDVMNRALVDENFYLNYLRNAIRGSIYSMEHIPTLIVDGVWSFTPATAEMLSERCVRIAEIEKSLGSTGHNVPTKRDVVEGMVLLYMEGGNFGAIRTVPNQRAFERFADSMCRCEREWEKLASAISGGGEAPKLKDSTKASWPVREGGSRTVCLKLTYTSADKGAMERFSSLACAALTNKLESPCGALGELYGYLGPDALITLPDPPMEFGEPSDFPWSSWGNTAYAVYLYIEGPTLPPPRLWQQAMEELLPCDAKLVYRAWIEGTSFRWTNEPDLDYTVEEDGDIEPPVGWDEDEAVYAYGDDYSTELLRDELRSTIDKNEENLDVLLMRAELEGGYKIYRWHHLPLESLWH